MTKFLWCAVLAAVVMATGGCAMSAADREFFGAHWKNPKELDEAQPPPTTNGMPNNAVDYE